MHIKLRFWKNPYSQVDFLLKIFLVMEIPLNTGKYSIPDAG